MLTLAYDPANRWTSAEYSGNKATENPHARFPRLSYGNNANNTKPSTFWKGNARYLRLQELSLNYNLRTPGLRKALGLQSIDFQVMCENLAVWDGAVSYTHLDVYKRQPRARARHTTATPSAAGRSPRRRCPPRRPSSRAAASPVR